MEFPQFIKGGGWSTQLILFSGFGVPGQTTGQLTFTQADGSPFNVNLQ